MMKENMIRPWLVEIYADDRCSDAYAAYAEGTADDVEECIGTNEELMPALVDYHIGEWEDCFDDDDDEWMDMIAPHVTEVTDEDLEDPDFVKWFNELEVIYDERNSDE